MSTYFCEEADVQDALQESDTSFGTAPLSSDEVQASIKGVSEWFAKATDGYWFDSTGASADLVDTTAATATDIIQSVPSSPYRQRGQLFASANPSGSYTPVYPKTDAGPYAKVLLPVLSVNSIDTLDVRGRDGDVTDWVADSDISSGRGEDYYLQEDRSTGYGRSYLYIRGATIGKRHNYSDLLTIDVTYGFDNASTPWPDVRRGIAALAAADLITDDDLTTLIPNNGQLIGVDTKADRLLDIALGDRGALSPYM